MLLRRVIDDVRSQNWTAVAIDFAIVVIGVFIGIQVSNWNEAREARSEEHSYLERLLDDMQASIARNETQIAFMERHAGYARLVLNQLDQCAVDEDARDAFATGLFLIGKSLPPVMVRGTVDELNTTGRFQYINNSELRRDLIRLIEYVEGLDRIFDTTLERAGPHTTYVESKVEYRFDTPVGGGENIRWENIKVDLDALCADQHFRNAVSAAHVYTNDMIFAGKDVLKRQRDIAGVIEKELVR